MNRLNLTADVIVVGSGPGGATVSKKLTESGKKDDHILDKMLVTSLLTGCGA